LDSWQSSILDLRRLTLFRGLLSRSPLDRLVEAAAGTSEPYSLLSEWIYRLTEERLLWRSPTLRYAADPWEAWLIDAVLSDDNLWTLSAERGEEPGGFLDRLAAHDLTLISRARGALAVLASTLQIGLPLDHWQAADDAGFPVPCRLEREGIARALAERRDWGELAGELFRYFRRAGAGPFNQVYTFYWDGGLKPIFNPDPVRFEHLKGYEREREQVINNTQRLVQGLPAHNLLLYGDRGTGKSATVKALAYRFGDLGLRLVEVPKSALGQLKDVIDLLSPRGLSFVVFVDDLSFEANETEYKELKACLEGSLQAQARNVRLYATSNRRHLIKEEFGDRKSGAWGTAADDVRSQDTLQEKLSLADRFAVTIIFPTPSQTEYLEIVYSLAAQYGIELDRQRLATLALRWATWQNGRSARTARQFIESLVGQTLPPDSV